MIGFVKDVVVSITEFCKEHYNGNNKNQWYYPIIIISTWTTPYVSKQWMTVVVGDGSFIYVSDGTD